MCGFVGTLGEASNDEEMLKKMTFSLIHRGPDSNSYWLDKNSNFSFGHTRLAIQDISEKGSQPMHSESGRYVIAFNGEIYNHLELRKFIELKYKINSFSWRGRSDTETILALIEHESLENVLKLLKGMFALALWDRKTKELFLARDRIGEKPLYYGWQKNSFIFGSELKALKLHSNFNNEINMEAIGMFMKYSYIPSPDSIYKGINKLLPGTFISLKVNQKNVDIVPKSYWSLADILNNQEKKRKESDDYLIEQYEKKLISSIQSQQISDVPIGTFLSGGVDSSLISALMQKINTNKIKTFTIGSAEEKNDESINARNISKHLGTDHTDLVIHPKDTIELIPKLNDIYDEPFADSSQLPTFLVSQLAKTKVKVCLSGDGGDELFGGYNRYFWSNRIRSLSPLSKRFLSSLINNIGTRNLTKTYQLMQKLIPRSLKFSLPDEKFEKLANILDIESECKLYETLVSTTNKNECLLIKDESYDNLKEKWNSLDNIEFTTRMMALDIQTYLADDILCKVDRASMSNSLEVRSPFLDNDLIKFAFELENNLKIRNGQGKWISRQLLKKYVPPHYLSESKMGFSSPIDIWLRGPLKEWASDLLSRECINKYSILNFESVSDLWNQHQVIGANKNKQIWNALILQSWLEQSNVN
tara:strand:- start:5489 stop:7429 length:1941 start_codon:yes stop_codon:yes gene_type:complete